jgi:hypothetical protein
MKYRMTEFDIRGTEKQLLGDTVILFFNDKYFGLSKDIRCPVPELDSMTLSNGERIYFKSTSNYHTYNFLRINFSSPVLKSGTMVELPISIQNLTGNPVVLESDTFGVRIATVFYQKGEIVCYEEVKDITGQLVNTELQTQIKMKVPDRAGEYYFRVVLRSGWLPPGLNSRIQKITVAE